MAARRRLRIAVSIQLQGRGHRTPALRQNPFSKAIQDRRLERNKKDKSGHLAPDEAALYVNGSRAAVWTSYENFPGTIPEAGATLRCMAVCACYPGWHELVLWLIDLAEIVEPVETLELALRSSGKVTNSRGQASTTPRAVPLYYVRKREESIAIPPSLCSYFALRPAWPRWEMR